MKEEEVERIVTQCLDQMYAKIAAASSKDEVLYAIVEADPPPPGRGEAGAEGPAASEPAAGRGGRGGRGPQSPDVISAQGEYVKTTRSAYLLNKNVTSARIEKRRRACQPDIPDPQDFFCDVGE